ncbi:helix-turn-helix domain-containing protein [Paeniglutamicibacter cryotolerans]|uniref:helix-turn-helix domain-containing protein n=1 Tax=Paeniglutamicibacter cryotolerans TaxID=670079 RepID=UPI003898DE0C
MLLDGTYQELSTIRRSVAHVAFSYGFSDLGRFAQAYCKRFGEPPSKTLSQVARN